MILLLQIIKTNGTVSSLLKTGLAYSQIARSISTLIEEGLCTHGNELLELTAEGRLKLSQLNEKYKRFGPSGWISPKLEHEISAIDKFDIFVPSKKAIKKIR